MVFSLRDHTVTRLSGICQNIFISPKSGQFVIGCPINEADGKNLLILEQDGSQWLVDKTPISATEMKDWAFSKDGEKILYANNQNQIFMLNKEDKKIKFPIGYFPGWEDVTMRVMQWSDDSSEVLIYGDDLGSGKCPSNDFNTSKCWMVLEPSTGKIIWVADQVADYDATLSPDGKWVVLFSTADISFREGFIYSLDGYNHIQIYNWVVTAISWFNHK